MTARHVVEELFDGKHGVPFLLLPNADEGSETIHLVGLRVEAVSVAVSHNDLALLRIDFRRAVETPTVRPPCAPISLREPEIGKNSLALGYSRQVINETFTYDAELRASQGIIEEVHSSKRDGALSNFPSIRTSVMQAWRTKAFLNREVPRT